MSLLTRELRNAWERYVEFHTRAPFKLRSIGVIGVLAFPAYGWIWTTVFPQPYENWTLRLVGSLLCAGLVSESAWPKRWRRYYLMYCYVVLMLCLPCFFTFMLLMNDANTSWLMSMMAAILFVLLLYDVLNAFLVTTLGTILGIFGYWAVLGFQPVPLAYIASLPIYVFAIMAFLFLSYGERRIAREQLQAARLLASKIAHEMRTPLLGISMDAECLQEDVQELNKFTSKVKDTHNVDAKPEEQLLLDMDQALRRIGKHASSANLVIDMLLTTVTQNRFDASMYDDVSLSDLATEAVDRYHFGHDEKQRVHLILNDTGQIRGPKALLIHVVFNLLKNSLRAISATPNGFVELEVSESNGLCYLRCRDNGCGIDPEVLSMIFIPFVTGERKMHGTGVGLPFCKFVVESIGGSISCKSSADAGTEFTLTFLGSKGDAADIKLASPSKGLA